MVDVGPVSSFTDVVCLDCGSHLTRCEGHACCDQGSVAAPFPCPWHGEQVWRTGTAAERQAELDAEYRACRSATRIVSGAGATLRVDHEPGCGCVRRSLPDRGRGVMDAFIDYTKAVNS